MWSAILVHRSHKDNTHRPTREHAPRHVSLFYYPGPVSIADGELESRPHPASWHGARGLMNRSVDAAQVQQRLSQVANIGQWIEKASAWVKNV